MTLTLQPVDRFSNSTAPRINHSLALFLVGRTRQAEAPFKAFEAEKLSELAASSADFGLAEVRFNEQQYDKAREASDRINVKCLLTDQMNWSGQARRQTPGAAGGQIECPRP